MNTSSLSHEVPKSAPDFDQIVAAVAFDCAGDGTGASRPDVLTRQSQQAPNPIPLNMSMI